MFKTSELIHPPLILLCVQQMCGKIKEKREHLVELVVFPIEKDLGLIVDSKEF